MQELEAIVIGAGIAGLSAGRLLAEAGRRVLVLEARERIGGRLLTVRVPQLGLPVELGAEFVHGCPQDLLDLIAEAGLTTFELDGEDFCWTDGKLDRCDQDDAFHVLAEMEEYDGPDISFAQYIRSKSLQAHTRERATNYVEGFNAADATNISVQALIRQQKAEDAIEGDRLFRIREGYDALARFQCEKLEGAGGVLTSRAPVVEVNWQPGRVLVKTRSGEEYTAPQAIIAVPLGTLHAGEIRFSPVPQVSLTAARLLAMGPVQRIVLAFRERFWASLPKLDKLGFLFSDVGAPPTWWTPYPNHTSTLTGWTGGPKATGGAGGEALLASSLQQLSRLLSAPVAQIEAQLQSWHTHDWQHDPWTLGAYTYVRVGGINASDQLAEPVENTLFFAGEHTDTSGHWGTVHGAYRSGLRAARQALGPVTTSRES